MFKRARIDGALAVDWKVILAAKKKRASNPLLRRFYQSCLDDFSRPLDSTPFVALDFETTGLDPQNDEIVGIGALPFSLQSIRCREARQWLVSPRRELSAESVVIHGITHTDIDSAPDLAGILEDVLATLAGRIIVVHYHRLERNFFNAALQRRLGEGIEFPVIDTMAIEAHIQRRQGGVLLQRLRGRRPLSVRLGESRQRYGLPGYTPHHALTDALATAELFQAQAAHHFSPTTSVAELLL